MSGKIVYQQPAAHACHPGWHMTETGGVTWDVPRPRPGDVWRCDDCGNEWVAGDALSNHATRGQCTVNAVDWRPSTSSTTRIGGSWREWRRQRKEGITT